MMDPFVNERDFALLRGDQASFSVLDNILHGSCAILWSDHRRLLPGLCRRAGAGPRLRLGTRPN